MANIVRFEKRKNILLPCNQICKRSHMDIADPPQASEIHFQAEIIMEILSKLPVRSLLRFKSVSKFWKALISDPYFKKNHLNYAKNDQNSHKFLILEGYPNKKIMFSIYSCPLSLLQLKEDVQKIDCSLNFIPWACVMLCCCDGMFFLIASDGSNRRFMLWNPSTRESIVLPDPEFSMWCGLSGLAYDVASDDYKILRIDAQGGNPQVSNEILALKSGSWRRVGKPSFRQSYVTTRVPSGRDCLAFVNGAFHWIAVSKSDKYIVVSFDISNEVYGEISLLETMFSKCDFTDFEFEVSALGDLLCFYSTTNYQGEGTCVGTFNLWVMKDYGVKESWTNLYTIQEADLFPARPKYRFADGEVLLSLRYLKHASTGPRCKTSSASPGPIFRTTKGQHFGSWPQCCKYREGFAYTESLIFPKLLT